MGAPKRGTRVYVSENGMLARGTFLGFVGGHFGGPEIIEVLLDNGKMAYPNTSSVFESVGDAFDYARCWLCDNQDEPLNANKWSPGEEDDPNGPTLIRPECEDSDACTLRRLINEARAN